MHRLVHQLVADQHGRDRHQAVRRIQHAQLDQLVGADVVGELRPGRGEVRSPGAELVLQHPLREVLAEHRRAIRGTAPGVQPHDVDAGHHRCDPVHHAVREADMRLDPLRQRRVDRLREAEEGGLRHVAVMHQVVAAEHGEGSGPRIPSAAQGFGHQSKHRARRRMAQVVRDIRGIQPEASGRIQVVAALGDGHADDPDRGIGQTGERCLRIARRVQIFHQRSDQPHRGSAVRRAYGQGIEALLRLQRLRLVAFGQVVEDADAEDAPFLLRRIGEAAIQVECLVRAMEVADPKMRDAGPHTAAVVAGTRDRRRQ